jgi:hypothetical protein
MWRYPSRRWGVVGILLLLAIWFVLVQTGRTPQSTAQMALATVKIGGAGVTSGADHDTRASSHETASPTLSLSLPASASPTRTALPSIPPQFPLAGVDRWVTSPALEHADVPASTTSSPVASASLLRERFVIAVVSAVRGNTNTTIDGCSLLSPMWSSSFARSASAHMLTRFYFVYDSVDPFYSRGDVRDAVADRLEAAVDHWAKTLRKLPAGSLVVSVHWVEVPYTGKPAWAQSDGVVVAYKEGADYAYRTNDDSYFPVRSGWMDYFVWQLRERHVPPNIGVAAPMCSSDPPWIFTHDFTHRTHAAIFGFHYPRGLPTWSADDWITAIYSDFPGHTWSTRMPFAAEHDRGRFGTRYSPDTRAARMAALNLELIAGYPRLSAWLLTHGDINATAVFTERQCC